MLEPCLICEGHGRQGSQACAYCAGSGRVQVHSAAPRTILLATGSCKLPLRQVQVDGALTIARLHSTPQP